jgi:hypothetical protein
MISRLASRFRAAVIACTVPAAVLAACAVAVPARAQQPAGPPPAQPQTADGTASWQFNVAPYLWLPTANVTLNYNLPPGLSGRLPTDVSSGPGDYLSHLNFATMVAADAQYGRFSLLTDFIYTNFSATGGASHIKSVDFLGLPAIPIDRSVQLGVGTTLKATIWTLAGGYTVLQGEWGNLDLLVGVRVLSVTARTNYSLAVSIAGPRANGPSFGGIGYVSGTDDVWNGIAGLRGRIRLANNGFFLPYYFDIGGGGSQPTWQIAGGIGYQTGWAGVSVTYRYLSFNQGSGVTVHKLSLGGPMMMVNFTF